MKNGGKDESEITTKPEFRLIESVYRGKNVQFYKGPVPTSNLFNFLDRLFQKPQE